MKAFIISYIQNLKLEDVEYFIQKNRYSICQKDIETIFQYIKYKGKEIVEGDFHSLEEIKLEVEPATYDIIMELFQKYKCYLGS